MKLLFDQNLSHRLVELLRDLHPGSAHMRLLSLDNASDREVWEYAKAHAYTIVTKDADFQDLSFIYGYPPKVVWIRQADCSTGQAARLLREHYAVILAAENDESVSVVMLS